MKFLIIGNQHCIEIVQLRSFFWSVFSRTRTEYGEILRSLRIQSECGKIQTRKNSVFGHFSRSAKIINWKKIKESIVEGLGNLIKGKLLCYKKIPEESLIPWKSGILTKVDKKVSKLKTRIKPSKFNLMLKQIDVITCLEALQITLVLVPIDKASNNVIICKIRTKQSGDL